MAGERVQPATVAGLSRSDTALAASEGKAPRTERGRRTLRSILDAAAIEFGEQGFPRSVDQRHHAPRRRRAGQLLHLFRLEGRGVPRTGPRHVGSGPRPCRPGDPRRARPDRRRARRPARIHRLRARPQGDLPHHRRDRNLSIRKASAFTTPSPPIGSPPGSRRVLRAARSAPTCRRSMPGRSWA